MIFRLVNDNRKSSYLYLEIKTFNKGIV
jgi:hypothetical protein